MASHMFLIVKLNKINPNRISSAFFSDWLTNTSLTPMLQIWHSQKLFLPLPNLPGLNTQPSNTLHLKISKKQDRLFAGMAKPLSTPRQKNSEAKPCRYHSSVSCRSSKFLCLSYQTRRVSCLSCSPWKMDFSQKRPFQAHPATIRTHALSYGISQLSPCLFASFSHADYALGRLFGANQL